MVVNRRYNLLCQIQYKEHIRNVMLSTLLSQRMVYYLTCEKVPVLNKRTQALYGLSCRYQLKYLVLLCISEYEEIEDTKGR